jgi:UDPglucose 6-dehydrogenase
MNIGIIGLGHVGGAVKFGFEIKRGHNVSVYDKKMPGTSLDDVFKKSELIFICVDTPMKSDGSCDTSNVENVCNQINTLAEKDGKPKDVIIKSTVEPGTAARIAERCKSIRLAVNPEFLLERSAVHDFCHQDICIVGTTSPDLYDKIVAAHGNLAAQFIKTTPVNAELAKYFCNVFNATRIIFANLFYDIAKLVGANYDECKSIATKRHNMIDAYLDCNENLRGFGGACLPKDSHAISAFCARNGLDYKILQGLLDDNERLNRGKQ